MNVSPPWHVVLCLWSHFPDLPQGQATEADAKDSRTMTVLETMLYGVQGNGRLRLAQSGPEIHP